MRILLDKIMAEPLNLDYREGKKLLINTANAHTFNLTRSDGQFLKAILKSDIIIPDGVGAIIAEGLLKRKKIKKISGYELFLHEMKNLEQYGGKCFFLGSTEKVLNLIRKRIEVEYPDVKVDMYSPPYKPEFSNEDNRLIREKINAFCPDVLFIGMTQPKQEKWAASNIDALNVCHVCSIGAVFDFYAGTVKRAPQWMINIGMEWLYRLIREPRRMWKRYIIGNFLFIVWLLKEML